MGNGLADAAWCAYAGQMANAHELSGILQAFYAFGATISPLIVTALATEGGPGWFAFYYVMAAAAALELVTSAYTFCKHLSSKRFIRPWHLGSSSPQGPKLEPYTWLKIPVRPARRAVPGSR